MPENAYDTSNPHPQVQTLYSYPLPRLYIFITLVLCIVPGVVTTLLLHWKRASIVLIFTLLGSALAALVLVHPKMGITKCRLVETPMGYETVYVHRPFVGRRRCEKGYGVTGGNPYKTETKMFGKGRNVRYEAALWVVDW